MTYRTQLPLLAATLALAACAAPQRQAAPASGPGPQSAIAGASQNCVELTRIREARVVDDQTIDFVQTSGQTLRNTLPYRCPTLGFEKAFSYETSLSRLCNVDIITVVVQGGGPRRGASCGLGNFTPYTPPPKG